MDETTMNLIEQLGINLSTLVFKGTATAIHSKIEAIKTEKNIETIRANYDEIINQLLFEREEAIRIAQSYKEEIERVIISDEDIIRLHNTVKNVLEILKSLNPNNKALDSFDEITNLINVDTLKAMQLLGFNYKCAIGQPLTELCANSISNLWNKGKSGITKRK